VALCLAWFRGGALVALRNRRRDRSPGEGARLGEEAVRAGGAAGNGAAPPRLVVSGSGASAVRRELGGDARGLEGPAEWPEARDAAWLGGLVS
jgi:hypothetical protein